ncbi:DUF1285 domain-containing protein [Sphingomonas sp. Mn802worker]|uniref:DUF1285 domain-containing protein n=1 Tax=Sphingomonas sp. Mn802worker TaxID=629773 RepID=UPI0004772AF7
MAPPPDFHTLTMADIARLADSDRLPPVERWHPAHCGDSEMRIARDGTWFHQGSPIGRAAMVRAFSRILRRETDGGYVLVTPVEKLDIAVEDAPFVAVELKVGGAGEDQMLGFRLNTGDVVIASAEHPLRFEERDDGPHPYVHVRGRLEALISRAIYYDLAEIALAGGDDAAGVWSGGCFFPLGTADATL